MRPKTPDLPLLLTLLDEAFDRKSWHGTNLRGSLRGLSAVLAAWRPAPGKHTIGEIAVHCAYWKYSVRRRLRGEKRGSFARPGSNWFALPEPFTESAWRDCVTLLAAEHKALRSAVAELKPNQLAARPPGSKTSTAMLVRGIALHDVYHAGQVQVIKGLQRDRDH